jgi:hypothetical protein
MGIIIALYGLEWQKLPDVPVGRGDEKFEFNKFKAYNIKYD